ncbi:unnamed protein product, partial [marine sediment metagenome]
HNLKYKKSDIPMFVYINHNKSTNKGELQLAPPIFIIFFISRQE